MQIKLWGVRGSLPSPMDPRDYRSRVHEILKSAQSLWKGNPDLSVDQIYEKLSAPLAGMVGGDTTCVEVRSGEDQLIFDMGTGARRLGYDMMARGHKGALHILMTHTHWDHIQGWPFFAPGYIPGNHVHFHSCIPDCEERFTKQQQFEFFPLGFQDMQSEKTFHTYDQGDSFRVGDFEITTEALIHPGGSTSYRVDKEGKRFIFATDTEFYGPDLEGLIEKKKPFFKDADLLIMDAQYSLKESEQKIGWGHTAMVIAVDCAIEWGVKRLALTHHEPAHDDFTTYKLFEEAVEHNRKYGDKLELLLARQGDTIEL
ncbi:MAG: MBL fold metallo-hydrolase [Leptospiraceae bacterium]|nr:MBL fold metallo-hydrolase [Leptospiraceae bacterium]